MNFKNEVKSYLNETIATATLTTKEGKNIKTTAGQSQRTRSEEDIKKLEQTAKNEPSDPMNIKSTWLDDKRSLDNYIKRYPTYFYKDEDTFKFLSSFFDDDEDIAILKIIRKKALDGDKISQEKLLNIAKKLSTDLSADIKKLDDPEFYKEINKKGIENVETMARGHLLRDRFATGEKSIIKIEKDVEPGEIRNLTLDSLLKKDGSKFVVRSDQLLRKVLSKLHKSEKEFNKDLEEYNKVVGKKGTKKKEIETLAPKEKAEVEISAQDLAKELENKYIEPIKDKTKKDAEKVKKDFRKQIKSYKAGNQSRMAINKEKRIGGV